MRLQADSSACRSDEWLDTELPRTTSRVRLVIFCCCSPLSKSTNRAAPSRYNCAVRCGVMNECHRYIRELTKLGFTAEEGATVPMQACAILTYADFRYGRSAVHYAALLHGYGTPMFTLVQQLLRQCLGVEDTQEGEGLWECVWT